MERKKWKKLTALFLCVLTAMLVMAGCGGESADDSANDSADADSAKEEEKLYPVTINGVEIRVGETTVQALLDAGLKVTVSEMTEDNQINQYEVDPEERLEANSYYSGGTVWITDNMFAHIAFVTGAKPVPMGEAVIASLQFSMQYADEEEKALILFDGVPVTEISHEKAEEMCPDFTGDDVMWLKYGLEYKYSMSFGQDGMLYDLNLSKKYDVDWNSEN